MAHSSNKNDQVTPQAKRELEAKLLEGLQGSPVEMTRKDWDAIRREALKEFDIEEHTEADESEDG